MEISDKNNNENTLTFEVTSNEENLFSLLKVYLNNLEEVDIAGYTKNHHLVDKTQFYLKVKKGSAEEVFKKGLKEAKKDLQNMRTK